MALPEDVRLMQIPAAHGPAGWGECYFCGREITANNPLTMWVVDGGAACLNWTDLHEGGPEKTAARCEVVRADGGNMDWFQVGPDCARKNELLPGFVHAFTEDD